MNFLKLLTQTDKRFFSVEILPRPGLSEAENLLRYAAVLERKPLFVDLPYHATRSESSFSGNMTTVFTGHPKTRKISEMLLQDYGLTPQPHVLCHGFSPEITEKKLLDFHACGVRNLLLLRGDITESVSPVSGQHTYAFQLVEQVKKLNAGINFRGEKAAVNTRFCTGVGGYPEPEEGMELAIQFLKKKVAAGADYIITQLFFDNARFYAFEKHCRDANIRVPIIPGISPLVSLNLLEKMPHFFKVSVPEKLQWQLRNCVTKTELEETGVAWARDQALDLYKNGFTCVHFFSFSRPALLNGLLGQLL